jgi:hypothetical protein
MLLEANCYSLKTIKTPFKMLKLHLRLVQHVSTQLGHPQVTHYYKEFLRSSTNQYKTHSGLSEPPQQHSEAANANGGMKYP